MLFPNPGKAAMMKDRVGPFKASMVFFLISICSVRRVPPNRNGTEGYSEVRNLYGKTRSGSGWGGR